MSLIFAKVVNMSISAGILILAVILVRFLFRKLPRKIFLIAWMLVMIRLVCPFTVTNSLSPVPSDFFSEHLSNAEIAEGTEWNGGTNRSDIPADPEQPAPSDPVTGISINIIICSIWLAGAVSISAAAVVRTLRLRKSVEDSEQYNDNVYICDGIKTSFVIGVLDPRIYISSAISEEKRGYIIDHEKEHIKHLDHLAKLLFYIITAVHWFNPLCHLAYHLFSEDLEMACDERTIEPRDAEYRAKYLQTLLDCGISLLTLRFGTLSFGNVGIKRRVERIMSFKKTKGITIAFFAVVCLSLIFFLMTNNAAAAGKPSEDHDDYVHVVIRDGNGNVVESVDVYQPDALSPPEPLPDLPDHGSVSSEDPEKYDALLKIREEILTEGVYRSSGELGDPVFAVCEGEVISSERDGGYGLCVTIKDNDGRIWKYGHCSKLTVEKGDYVSFGDLIAYVGTTGLIEKPGIIIRIVK